MIIPLLHHTMQDEDGRIWLLLVTITLLIVIILKGLIT